LREVFPRCKARLDYAVHGEWCSPEATFVRLLMLAFTVLIACPIAIVIDLVDWATFPAGRAAAFVLFIVLIVALA
jgi:hypothetical protein